MLVVYLFTLYFLLALSNVYIVWLFMELMFIVFFLFVLNYESKSVGLIIYFFFQSVISLLLFSVIFFSMEKLIFMLLIAKLGLFPFFYWMIIVSVKVGMVANLFILSLQKISVFWLLWLLIKISFSFVLLLVYLSIFLLF